MKYVIEEHTDDYRGDHAADSVIAHETLEGETVEAMIKRCLRKQTIHIYDDYLVIRLVKEAPEEEE